MYTPQFLTLVGKLNDTLTDLRINTLYQQMLERDGEDTGKVTVRASSLEHHYNRIKMFLTYNFNDEYTNYCKELMEMNDVEEIQK